MTNIVQFPIRSGKIPSLEELAKSIAQGVYESVLRIDEGALKTLTAIHYLASERQSNVIMLSELIPFLPYKLDGAWEYMTDLEDNHHVLYLENGAGYFDYEGRQIEDFDIYILGHSYEEE